MHFWTLRVFEISDTTINYAGSRRLRHHPMRVSSEIFFLGTSHPLYYFQFLQVDHNIFSIRNFCETPAYLTINQVQQDTGKTKKKNKK